jgi:oligoribonuclease NrnB/cAMP/cGMP phosphodiesterase (DHH superfamily)
MIEPSSINMVIYHKNCSDGFGAAYSAWKLLGNKAEYIACTHGDTPPDVTGKKVAILDFSFDNQTTKSMIEKAESLIVIDHHKSAMVELHDISNTVFDMNKSGAMMAWEFFHPSKEAPKFIEYIQDRDLWKWEMPYSKEFSAAFDMVPWEFSAFEEFEDDSVIDDAIKRGSYILAYSKTVVKKICDKATRKSMTVNDKTYDTFVVNSSHWMSEIGATLAKDCDVAMIYYFDHDRKEYKVSLRAFHEHIDVSEISKFFGGGGHKKAGGFVLPPDVHPDSLFSEIEETEEIETDYFGAD